MMPYLCNIILKNTCMLDKKEKTKLRLKAKDIILRLRALGHLPIIGAPMSEEQQKIYDDIFNGDFTYWEKFKSTQTLWDNKKKSPKEKYKRLEMASKRSDARVYLRKYAVLPPFGVPMNEEQKAIDNQIGNNDFSFYDEFKRNKFIKHCTTEKETPIKTEVPENEAKLRRILTLFKFFSKKKGIKANLKINDIKDVLVKQNGLCKISNTTMTYVAGKKNTLTIRVINENKEVTKDNIILSCKEIDL